MSDSSTVPTIPDFDLSHVLGQGGGGIVWYATNPLVGPCAIKMVGKHEIIVNGSVQRVMEEKRIMCTVQHPFIIDLHFAFQDDTRIFFVLELAEGGDLYDLLGTLPKNKMDEDAARFFLVELVLVLEYLHDQGIVFRDLKPENVLITRTGHIRVSDFGLAKTVEKEESASGDKSQGTSSRDTICGTPEYMAPETIMEKNQTCMTDYWALGIIAYEMIIGKTPWPGNNTTDLFFHIITQAPKFPADVAISKEAKDLVNRLMTKTPEERIGYRGAAELKAHPFFRDIDWEDSLANGVTPPFPTQPHSTLETRPEKNMNGWHLRNNQIKTEFKPYTSPKHGHAERSMEQPCISPQNSVKASILMRQNGKRQKTLQPSGECKPHSKPAVLAPVLARCMISSMSSCETCAGAKRGPCSHRRHELKHQFQELCLLASQFQSVQGTAQLDCTDTFVFCCPFMDRMMGWQCQGCDVKQLINRHSHAEMEQALCTIQNMVASNSLHPEDSEIEVTLVLELLKHDGKQISALVTLRLDRRNDKTILWHQKLIRGR